MKKTLFILGIAVLMAAACARENAPEATVALKKAYKAGETVQITATLPEVEKIDTRVSLSGNGKGGFIPSWQEGDQILVGNEMFTLVSSQGAKGVFEGKAPSGDSFDITTATLDYMTQTIVQKADGDFSHLHYEASLTGVDSFEDIHFNYGWAAEHGGTFSQSGCLCLVLNLPASASAVASVSFAGEGLDERSIDVEDGTLDGLCFTAYLPAGEIVLSADKEVTITVTTVSGDVFTNTFLPGPQTLYQGYVHRLVTSSTSWSRALSGKGSESDPYLIGSVEDFNNIRNLIEENTYTWFRQIADIDFSGVQNWLPLNDENKAFGVMYDGQNHKITHFSCTASSRASLFGILHGEVKNLTVEDAEVVTTANSPCGIVAAWVGNIDSTLQGRLENVHVVRGKVSTSTYANIGGLTGRSGAGTFVNCSFSGVVERTAALTYESGYHSVGGILGEALGDVSISDCQTSGTLTTASGRAAGGILGMCSTALDIANCTSTMNITARDDVAGGIVGYYGNGTISGCTVESNITVRERGSGTSYVGGIAAHTSGSVSLTRCSYKGALSAYSGVVAGILGQCNTSTGDGCVIKECASAGSAAGTTVMGGIIGRSSNTGLTVSDCVSSMDIVGTGSYNGGILGDAPKNTTVSRCVATGAVSGVYALGGIVGRAFGRQGSSNSLDTDINTTVEDCIAFNSSIKTVTTGGENPASHYSGGAVVGCSSRPNTLRNCWRSTSMVFEFYSDSSLNELFDHADSSPSSPLAQPAGSAKWFSPYHGKAAANGATASSVARSIGWSETTWDLSGSVPALRL